MIWNLTHHLALISALRCIIRCLFLDNSHTFLSFVSSILFVVIWSALFWQKTWARPVNSWSIVRLDLPLLLSCFNYKFLWCNWINQHKNPLYVIYLCVYLQPQKSKVQPTPVDFTITPEMLQNVREVKTLDSTHLMACPVIALVSQ